MSQSYARTYRDFSGEVSTHKINLSVITVGTIVGVLANITNYSGAVDAITLGEPAADETVLNRSVLSGDNATSEFAQRELKWLVHYHGDTSGKKFTQEIPCADPTGRLLPGTDLMDLTETAAAAWKTAFEGINMSPDDDTETTTVDYVELVGRDL